MTNTPPQKRATYDTGLRQRGELADQVKRVCDMWITGELTVKDDMPLTPHRVSLAIKEMDQLDDPPSTGAIKSVFDRWESTGFATLKSKPCAFEDYTEEGKLLGWRGIKERRRAEKSDERASQKNTK